MALTLRGKDADGVVHTVRNALGDYRQNLNSRVLVSQETIRLIVPASATEF